MKERIDHSNYEAWLLDRLEGRLDPAQERALTAFLALHPELDPAGDPLPSFIRPKAELLCEERASLKRHLPPQGLPTLTTLEDFLIARGEGDLDAAQEAALQVLLDQLPDGAQRARTFAALRIQAEHVRYSDHTTLLRSLPPTGLPTNDTVGDFLIAQHEGDLDAAQNAALEHLLTTDLSARHEQALIARTRIAAAPIVYPHKAALKRGAVVIPLFARNIVRWAAAASVAVLLSLGLWLLQGRGPATNEQQVAVTEDASDPGGAVTNGSAGPEVHPSTSEEPVATANTEDAQPMKAQDRLPSVKAVMLPTRAPELVAEHDVPQLPSAVIQDTMNVVQPTIPRGSGNTPLEPAYAQNSTPPSTPAAAPTTLSGATAIAAATPVETGAVTVPGLLARAFRRSVLEQPDADTAPLSGDDALAAVDVGLRAVAGDRAGLTTERVEGGAVRRFDLRLGSGLSIRGAR